MAFQNNSVELDLVNEVLYNTGEHLVNSLEGGPIISQIRFALKREKRKLLNNKKFGWSWNTIDLSITPDVNGEFRINDNVIELISDKPTYRVIDGKLRDIKTNSTTNLDVSNVQAVVDLDYGDIPQAAQEYLTAMVTYKESVNQAMSKQEKDDYLSLALQAFNDLREAEIYTIQSNESHNAFGYLNSFDPLTVFGNMSRT